MVLSFCVTFGLSLMFSLSNKLVEGLFFSQLGLLDAQLPNKNILHNINATIFLFILRNVVDLYDE